MSGWSINDVNKPSLTGEFGTVSTWSDETIVRKHIKEEDANDSPLAEFSLST